MMVSPTILEQLEPIAGGGPEVRWFAMAPLLVLAGGALLMLVVGALTPTWPKGSYAFVSAAVAGTAAALAMVNWDDLTDSEPALLVAGVLAWDAFAMLATITICVSVILVSMLTDQYLRETPNDGPEVYALYIVAAVGGIVMASANDFIVLFLGLETLSLSFYVLAASNRRNDTSAESGLKYFVLGGFASAIFLYGIALIYGATGTTNISEMIDTLSGTVNDDNDVLALAGVALLLVGLGFKVASAPFHMWAPDVYQGAPSPVTAFMASAGKVAAFGAMLRVLVIGLPFYRDDWRPIIWALAVASLLIGSFLAVVQTDVKRMLAYSSVSHVGFILVGVEAAGHHAGEVEQGSGMSSVVLYLLLYTVLVIGSFAVITLVAGDREATLDVFNGLSQRRPVLALGFTVFLLAQAGVPLTSGFIAKFGVIQAAVEENSYAVAIIAMVAAVVAAFLYLRIMMSIWLKDPDDDSPVAVPVGAGVAITAAAAFTMFVGVLPGWLIDATDTVVAVGR